MNQKDPTPNLERFQKLLQALKTAGTSFSEIAEEIGTPYHVVVMIARGDFYSKRIVNAIARHLEPTELHLLPQPPATRTSSRA